MASKAAKTGTLLGANRPRALLHRKPVYLPEFVIALVRTPYLSARHAQFRVPLNFNKLDLRSYLKQLYGVDVLSVRSYVQQQPITRITRDGRSLGRWRRPKSEKRMTVELQVPFVWPEEPEDLSRWEKESWDASERTQREYQKQNRQKPHSAEEPDEAVRKAFEEQAKELKNNPEQWRPTWKALGLDPLYKKLGKPTNAGSPTPPSQGA